MGHEDNASAKCKIKSPSDQAVVLDGSEVEHVKEFVFLGSVVPNSSDDVRRRIMLASAAFGRLKIPIWQRREQSKPLTVRLYKALILPIATCAAETWTVNPKIAENWRHLKWDVCEPSQM